MDSALVNGIVWTRMVPELATVTIVCPPVSASATSRASLTEQVALGIAKSAPPRNSIPRFSPRKASEATATSRMIAEKMYHRFHRPTKS